jgi:hypothetical protein
MTKIQKTEAKKETGKTKKDKFVELAEIRVPKVLRQITQLGNLSDKSKFEYTDKQVKQIYKALEESLDRMKARFENGEDKEEVFKLS